MRKTIYDVVIGFGRLVSRSVKVRANTPRKGEGKDCPDDCENWYFSFPAQRSNSLGLWSLFGLERPFLICISSHIASFSFIRHIR